MTSSAADDIPKPESTFNINDIGYIVYSSFVYSTWMRARLDRYLSPSSSRELVGPSMTDGNVELYSISWVGLKSTTTDLGNGT
ncbi:hypothetical protein E2542_SST00609 [Spatholobus suberectus]|nr:hypothetical protein E2542_SST00609 [Spatholobus suberectus]